MRDLQAEIADRAIQAESLLREWYLQWANNDDMPAKMKSALHVRTALFLGESVEHALALDKNLREIWPDE